MSKHNNNIYEDEATKSTLYLCKKMEIKEQFNIDEQSKQKILNDFSELLNSKKNFLNSKYNLKNFDKNFIKEGESVFVVDLGGSTLKFAVIKYFNNTFRVINSKRVEISETESEENLFDFILEETVKYYNENLKKQVAEEIVFSKSKVNIAAGNSKIKSSLILSYKLKSMSTSECFVEKYCKNFSGNFKNKNIDPLKYLNNKLGDLNIPIYFEKVINDSVAVTISKININHTESTEKNLDIGFVYGTGANLAIPINGEIYTLEIGGFYSKHIPLSDFDKIIINEISNQNFNFLETITAGIYKEKLLNLIKKEYKLFSKENIDDYLLKCFYERAFLFYTSFISVIKESLYFSNEKIRIVCNGSPLNDEKCMNIFKKNIYESIGTTEIVNDNDSAIIGGAMSLGFSE